MRRIKHCGLVFWLGCLALAGHAQVTDAAFQKEQFTRDGKQLRYRILYPENFDAAKHYPVILFLHGAGERGTDNESQLVHGSKLFLSEGFRRNFPAVVIFPQCPKDSYWSNVTINREELPLKMDFQNGGEPTYALQLVMDLMDSIRSQCYSKDDQIYVGGLSMGGMGTFEIVSRRPELFAAAFPICGGASPEIAPKLVRVPFWVFHGGQDNVVLPSYTTEMVISIRRAGGQVKYTLYPEANHNSWDAALAEPGLMMWLFSHHTK